MKRKVLVVLMGFFLVSTLLGGLALAGKEEDSIALAKKGVDFIEKNGIEKAIEAFKTPEFQNGELYVFCYDYKGNCLAHGVLPQLVGKNLWDMKTPTGKYLIRELAEAARKGGGWVDYQWIHESTKVVTDKTSYAMPIPGKDAFVACGFYK
jgi:signal transduction histidine kinase